MRRVDQCGSGCLVGRILQRVAHVTLGTTPQPHLRFELQPLCADLALVHIGDAEERVGIVRPGQRDQAFSLVPVA